MRNFCNKLLYHNKVSIQIKLFSAFMIVITTCMIIFSTTSYVNFSKTLTAESESSISQLLSLSTRNMTASISSIEQTLISIQADSSIEDLLSSAVHLSPYEEINFIEQRLNKIDIFRSSISNIYFYVADRPDYPLEINKNISSTDYVKNELWYQNTISKKGETYLTIMDAYPAKGVLCLARCFLDTRTHETLGVIRIDIDLASFLEDISSITLGKTGKIFLVYENHIVNPWNNSYIHSFVNEKNFFEHLDSGTSSPQYIKINDEMQVIACSSLITEPLKLVCAARYMEINNSNELVKKSTILTAILALFISFLIMFFVSRWITNPIRRLTKYMEDFRYNRAKIPAEMETNDEIGQLCRSYNLLLNTIEALLEDVKALYNKQKIFELKALQAQINPHFLYNTLDSINWMAKKHKADDISSMVTSLGTFFRHTLNKGSEYTPIKNELQQIASYTNIQKIRFTNKFDISYDIDPQILSCSIIKLTIQPLVENSIIHGFEDLEEGGKIAIRGWTKQDYIYIEVKDNGCGCDTDQLNSDIQRDFSIDEPIEKYGLNNVNQRIKLYFDQTCGLHFESNPEGGIRAVIKILRQNYETEASHM